MLRHAVVILFVFADIQSSYPLPFERTKLSEVIQIPETNGQQLDLTSTLQNAGTLSERSKRTIGLLRDLFPELTKQIDDSVNKVVSQIIRVVGPAVLRGAVRNRNSLPNARSSLDIEFDSDEEIDNTMSTNSSARVSVELPTILPYVKKENFSSSELINGADNSENVSFPRNGGTEQNNLSFKLNAMNNTTKLVSTISSEPIEGNRDYISMRKNPTNYMCNGSADLHLSECPPSKNHITGYSVGMLDQPENNEQEPVDNFELSIEAQQGTDGNRILPDINFGDTALDLLAVTDDIGGQTEKSSESGSFLFDVIRLFSSSAPTQSDGYSNAEGTTITKPAIEQLASPDGYTEAIPGPVTRLFVLANRGLSNLIQDLILMCFSLEGAWKLAALIGWVVIPLQTVNGHGRLMDPPSRNAMWRFGFPNPVNYNDNELFCGGYAVQWEQNNGRCGVCGDAFQLAVPRPHEAGGLYAQGIISRFYSVGQDIEVEVELTANHYGRFEIFLCPNNNPQHEASQECFDQHPLYVADSNENRFYVPTETKKKGTLRYSVRLPPYVTCTQCVLQWTYYTGNMWGACDNGTEAVGCGNPETFRNCADIAITSNTGGSIPPIFIGNVNPFLLYYRDIREPTEINVFPLIVREQVCVPTPTFRNLPGLENWCQSNCLRYPPNCPQSVCHCLNSCEAIGTLAGKYGADVHCQDTCIKYPPDCPLDQCLCA